MISHVQMVFTRRAGDIRLMHDLEIETLLSCACAEKQKDGGLLDFFCF